MQTEYRGYSICYGDNDDKWWCSAIGYQHEKLSKVKAKIDSIHLKMRKAAAIECYHVSGGGSGPLSLDEATVIDYAGPVRAQARSFERNPTGEVIGHKFAIMTKARHSEQRSRQVVQMDTLVTDEAFEVLERVRVIEAQIKALGEQRKRMVAEIPRMKFEDFAELVAASEARIEEV